MSVGVRCGGSSSAFGRRYGVIVVSCGLRHLMVSRPDTRALSRTHAVFLLVLLPWLSCTSLLFRLTVLYQVDISFELFFIKLVVFLLLTCQADSYADLILFGSIGLCVVYVRFWPINRGNKPCASRNESRVSPRGTQLKNPLLQRRSSSFCPRCIFRRKIV